MGINYIEQALKDEICYHCHTNILYKVFFKTTKNGFFFCEHHHITKIEEESLYTTVKYVNLSFMKWSNNGLAFQHYKEFSGYNLRKNYHLEKQKCDCGAPLDTIFRKEENWLSICFACNFVNIWDKYLLIKKRFENSQS